MELVPRDRHRLDRFRALESVQVALHAANGRDGAEWSQVVSRASDRSRVRPVLARSGAFRSPALHACHGPPPLDRSWMLAGCGVVIAPIAATHVLSRAAMQGILAGPAVAGVVS